MANMNKVILCGRITRDVEARQFANGGKVVSFSFVTNNRKKDTNGQWVDDPMFIDCKVFNRGAYNSADWVETNCYKGQQILLEGKLALEQWEDKQTGQKRSRHVILVDSLQVIDRKKTDETNGEAYQQPVATPPAQAPATTTKAPARPAATQQQRKQPPPQPVAQEYEEQNYGGGDADEIPF